MDGCGSRNQPSVVLFVAFSPKAQPHKRNPYDRLIHKAALAPMRKWLGEERLPPGCEFGSYSFITYLDLDPHPTIFSQKLQYILTT